MKSPIKMNEKLIYLLNYIIYHWYFFSECRNHCSWNSPPQLCSRTMSKPFAAMHMKLWWRTVTSRTPHVLLDRVLNMGISVNGYNAIIVTNAIT